MLQLLKHNLTFYIGYLMLLMFAVIFILNTDQLELHSIINQHVGISFWDQFFKYITHLGDGLFLMTLAVGLFLVDSKKALTLLIAYGISGGLTQFLKVNFFNDVMRPFFYHSFHGFPLHIVEGVDMHSQNSFPSGHSTTAFCLFTIFALFLTNKWHKLILLFIAVLVAFSRVYLSQHFLEDITMGSFIGISLSTGVYYLFYSTSMSLKLVSLQQPLAKIIRNRNE